MAKKPKPQPAPSAPLTAPAAWRLANAPPAAKPPPKHATSTAPSASQITAAPDYIDRWLQTQNTITDQANQALQIANAPDPQALADSFAALAGGGSPTVGGDPSKDKTATGGPKSSFDASLDYSKLFDFFGLPADIKQKIQDYIAQSQGDVGQATPLILAYIRGTDWYAKTYQGIQYGVANGLFGANPESDYRQYVNSANQYYNQYLSRSVGTDEIVNSLKEGVDVSTIGKRLEGQSYAQANSQDWQYLSGAFGQGQLSDQDVTALGRESVGLKSTLGDKLQAQLDLAHRRMSTIFQGTLATPNLSRTSRGGISTGQDNIKPDIGA